MRTQGSQTTVRCPTADRGHTVHVTAPRDLSTITFGRGVAGDHELRLCGDLSGGARALELGVSSETNALAFALAGAKSIAVDPDPARIGQLREMAAEHEVHIECHQAELADLGFATSGSIEVVVANHTLADVDDLGRLLRQVHRVLRPSRPFVIVVDHPFDEVLTDDTRSYGSGTRTIGDWFTALGRANFRVDAVHELGADSRHRAPTTLVLRARKEGS
jgi:SAM-dependent methyltransferase